MNYKDKVVAVIGGGNTALTDTIYLSNIASKVYLIHRRSEFRADKIYVNEINKINNIKETREIPKITTFLLKTLKDLNIKSKYDYIFNEMKKKYNINPNITRGGAFLKSFLKQGK